MPLAPGGYKFHMSVQDYGAKGDGITDDTEAINKSVAQYSITYTTLMLRRRLWLDYCARRIGVLPGEPKFIYQKWILTDCPAYGRNLLSHHPNHTVKPFSIHWTALKDALKLIRPQILRHAIRWRPNDRSTIKDSQDFTSIALIDTDVYIPGGEDNE